MPRPARFRRLGVSERARECVTRSGGINVIQPDSELGRQKMYIQPDPHRTVFHPAKKLIDFLHSDGVAFI